MRLQMMSLLDTQSLNVQVKVANPFLMGPMPVTPKLLTKTPIAMEGMEGTVRMN